MKIWSFGPDKGTCAKLASGGTVSADATRGDDVEFRGGYTYELDLWCFSPGRFLSEFS